MKLICSMLALFFGCQLPLARGGKIICYYDSFASEREGLAKLSVKDMEECLQFCGYMIYRAHEHIQELTNMYKFKRTYPHVKFLLSTTGDVYFENTPYFFEFLQADLITQDLFVETTVRTLRKYRFDGLSLELPLPPKTIERPDKWHYNIIKFFKSRFAIDSQTEYHKRQLAALINKLSIAFKAQNLILSLTVPPNVDSESYFDAEAIEPSLDFIILSAFDFHIPEINLHEADYTAPIYAPIKKGNRLLTSSIDQLVKTWTTTLQVPSEKLVLGVTSWGRTWKLTNISENLDLPPVIGTNGPAPGGPETKLPGYLSWPEICQLFPNSANKSTVSRTSDLHVVVDPTKKYGNYAYRAADANGENGIWISYEDPSTIGVKAGYAKHHNLGGVALVDVNDDDTRGRCNGTTFPLLRSIANPSEILIVELTNDSHVFTYKIFVYLPIAFIVFFYA